MAQISDTTQCGSISHSLTSKIGFHDLPFDLRLALWHEDQQNSERILLTTAKLEAKPGGIDDANKLRASFKDFILHLAPSSEQVFGLASIFFQPELLHYGDTTWLQHLVRQSGGRLMEQKNTVFIDDLNGLFNIALVQEKSPRITALNVPCSFEGLAVYSNPKIPENKENEFFELLLSLLDTLPLLKTLYIVLESNFVPNSTPLPKSRLINSTRGVLLPRSQSHADNDEIAITNEKTHEVGELHRKWMVEFCQASKMKSNLLDKFGARKQARLARNPQSQLDEKPDIQIKIVQWARDEII